MTQIVSFSTDEYRGFSCAGPPPWLEGRWVPNEIGATRKLELLTESAALPIADFMTVSGVGFSARTIFVVSEAAFSTLLAGKFGVLSLPTTGLPPEFRLVVVAGRLDAIDFDRSVERFPGRLEGLHTYPAADELAGEALFGVLRSNESWLLCGDRWKNRYLQGDFSGLTFEPAIVG